jgi:hypothetical protein
VHGCVNEVLRSKSVISKLKRLEDKKSHELTHELIFKKEDFLLMHDIATMENFELDAPSWDLVLACLLTKGLLTLSEKQDSQWFYNVKIPNFNVKYYFKRFGLFKSLYCTDF